MRAAARRMSPRGYGKIVVTGSLYSVTGDRFFGAYGYAAAKGGVLSLVRTAAIQLAPKGVRVNAILPGYIRTRSPAATCSPRSPRPSTFRRDARGADPARRARRARGLKGAGRLPRLARLRLLHGSRPPGRRRLVRVVEPEGRQRRAPQAPGRDVPSRPKASTRSPRVAKVTTVAAGPHGLGDRGRGRPSRPLSR